MYKRFASTFIAAMLLLSIFAGCGAQNNTTSSTAPAGTTAAPTQADEKATLTLWAYTFWNGVKGDEKDGQPEDYWKNATAEYSKARPNVTVNFELIPYDGGPDKVNVAIASKTQPDVLADDMVRLTDYAGRGVLAPLDENMSPDDLADLVSGVWDNVKSKADGKHYILPWFADIGCLLINKSLFDKAGASSLLPQNEDRTWNFDQFEAAAKAVTKDGIYGYALYCGNEQGDKNNLMNLFGFGATLFNDDYTQIALNSPAGVEGLDYLVKLHDEKLIPPGAETLKSGDAVEMFKQQKTAITYGSTYINYLVKSEMEKGNIKPFDVTYAMFPSKDGVKPYNFEEAQGFAVFKSGDVAREEWSTDLIKYLGGPEASKDVVAITGIAYRKSSNEAIKVTDKAMMDYAANHAYKYVAGWGSWVKGYAQVRAALFPQLQAAFIHAKTSQQALDDFAKTANEAIE